MLSMCESKQKQKETVNVVSHIIGDELLRAQVIGHPTQTGNQSFADLVSPKLLYPIFLNRLDDYANGIGMDFSVVSKLSPKPPTAQKKAGGHPFGSG